MDTHGIYSEEEETFWIRYQDTDLVAYLRFPYFANINFTAASVDYTLIIRLDLEVLETTGELDEVILSLVVFAIVVLVEDVVIHGPVLSPRSGNLDILGREIIECPE